MELDTSSVPFESSLPSGQEMQASRKNLQDLNDNIHFIGIGGIGMSALARLLLAQGKKVSGSDKSEGAITDELKALGADICIGHKSENLGNAQAVVISTAINRENPELKLALEKEIPIFHRSEVLAHLASGKELIAVSGTHGKTTTTGMISQILLSCGKDPSVVVGGVFAYMKANAHAGNGRCFVAEADESDRTHATLSSQIAVVTNIEADHMENYPGGFEQVLSTMASFANLAKQAVVLCADDAGCRSLVPSLKNKIVSYGVSADSDYRLKTEPDSCEFDVFKNGRHLGKCSLLVPGTHNKLNALAAIAVCMELGLAFEEVSKAIAGFGGVARRFEQLGESCGVLVVDDYGHHPTEVRATLEAAQQFKKKREKDGRIVALFQPHQPGRLRDLWDEFSESFKDADQLFLADVYVARGGAIEGINSESFSLAVKHENVTYLAGPVADLPSKLRPYLRSGDIVLTIGAGDITNVGRALLALLSEAGLDGRIY